METINLDVRWKRASRSVTVRLKVEAVSRFYVGGATSPRSGRPSLDAICLETRESLDRFLADITRAQADGSTVEAVCLDDDVPDLLRLLGVSGQPQDPIEVNLPDNA